MTRLEILAAAPLTTVQDAGRFGALRHGVTASGPMDRRAFDHAGALVGTSAMSGLEFGAGRLAFRVLGGPLRAGFAGGGFHAAVNGAEKNWPGSVSLQDGDEVEITPGSWGNFGYLRFERDLDVPVVMGSRATSLIAALGGLDGRTLKPGDRLELLPVSGSREPPIPPRPDENAQAPIRVIWGLHANRFSKELRRRFLSDPFRMSARLDRMGARLDDISGVFTGQEVLSLVSDTVVPGDIQILGDGTPIILMRDHQPTGGYPRIATVITPDIDRLAQIRPGRDVRFTSVTVAHAYAIQRGQV